MSEPTTPKFEIGLVMAGAVSAGAYTGGVIDFLMEALETWDRLKEAGDPRVPTHAVQIRVITGASAGAITGAVFGSAIRDANYPLQKPTRLYQTWVEQVHIDGLLSDSDLTKFPDVRSVLNSDFLDGVADRVLSETWNRPDWPAYLADPLALYLTVTNLRGVPYDISFNDEDDEAPSQSQYAMSLHADYMEFSLCSGGAEARCPPSALNLGDAANRDRLQGNWRTLKTSALASGAFPIGLAAQVLERTGTWAYDLRLWPVPQNPPKDGEGPCVCTEYKEIPPAWGDHVEDQARFKYQFVNVDGGVANNEPFELARRYLAGDDARNPRSAEAATRAVLMIDPFPNDAGFDPNYDAEARRGLLAVVPELLSAMVSQLRFKTEELELARDSNVFSRWLISPKRYQPQAAGSRRETLAKYALACGGLSGFGGFFAKPLREHDYQLGRRNAQKFLRDTFVLDDDNPVFAGHWTEDQKAQHRPGQAPRLPIIPLFDACAEDVPQPSWPKGCMTPDIYRRLTINLQKRTDRLVDRFIETLVKGSFWERMLLKIGWNLLKLRRQFFGESIVDPLVRKVRTDFAERGLNAE